MTNEISFRFARERVVLYPVVLPLLIDDGSGTTQEITIRVKYKLLTRRQMREHLEEEATRVKEGGLTAALDVARMNEREAKLHEHVLGWDGIVDADSGEALPFTPENLDALLAHATIANAIEKGLWDASRDAPLKN